MMFLLSASKFVKRPSEVKRFLFVLGRQLVLHFPGVRSNCNDEDREIEVRKGKEEAGSDPGNIFSISFNIFSTQICSISFG